MLAAVLVILVMIHMFGAFGNVNGIAGASRAPCVGSCRRRTQAPSPLHTHPHPHPAPAGLGGGRFAAARAAGASSGAVSYWEAMTVVESLGWTAIAGGLGWIAYKLLKPPTQALAAVAATP